MYVFSELRNITKIRKGIKKWRETETDREKEYSEDSRMVTADTAMLN